MSRLLANLLARLVKSRRRGSWKRRPSRQLLLERLEDRTVPTVLFTPQHGAESTTNGTVLNDNPGTGIYMIYWGSYWKTTAGANMASSIQNSVNGMFWYSPYLDGLQQYGVNHRAFQPAITNYEAFNYTDPPTDFHDTDVQNVVLDAIYNKGLPEADYYAGHPIYFVVTPPNFNYVDHTAAAWHNYFYDNHDPSEPDQTIYGWIGGWGDYGLDIRTQLLSHETAVTMSDPYIGSGIRTTGGQVPSGTSAEICDYEAINYTYRLKGYLTRSYWSTADGAYRVSDGNSQKFVVNNGQLIVNGDQVPSNYDDTITLDVNGGGVRVTLNGEVAQFDPGAITSVVVNTGGGNDTINVLRTVVPVNINNNSSIGGDKVYVGTGGSALNGTMANINGYVNVYGAGSTYVYLGDSGDSAQDTVNMYGGEVTGLSPANIYWTASSSYAGGVTYLEVRGSGGGSTYTVNNTSAFYYYTYLQTGGGNDVVNVLATTGGLQVNNSGGPDYVNVGSGGGANNGTMTNINGYVDVYGAGSTHLVVGDSADTTSRTVNLYDGKLTGLSLGNILWTASSGTTGGVTYLAVLGSSGGSTYTANNTSAFNLYTSVQTGGGSDTVSVLATTGNLYVYNSGGQDYVYGGSGGTALNGTMANINGLVSVYGPGATQLLLSDSADTTGRTVNLYDGRLTGLSPANILWTASSSATGGVNYLDVRGSGGGSTYTVNNTSAFYYYTNLDTGAGNDTVNVLATSGKLYAYNAGGQDNVYVGSGGAALNGTMANINGALSVYGAGSTSLHLGDSGDAAGRAVTMNDGSLTGLSPATIYWTPSSTSAGGVIYLDVLGSSVGSTYTVNATSPFYNYIDLRTGGGSDTVNVLATTGKLYVTNLGGQDNVYVGSGGAALNGTMANINGNVTVGGAGSTYLYLGDSSDTISRTVNLYDGEVTGLAPANIYWTASSSATGGVTYLEERGSGAGSTYTVNATSAFYHYTNLQTGASGDTVNVLATTGNLYIYNNGGPDIVHVGSAAGALNGTMANINGFVYVQGAGSTLLELGDAGDTTGRTVNMYNDHLTGLSPGAIYWTPTSTSTGGVTSLNVWGSGGGSNYTVNATSAFYFHTSLRTGGGSDLVYVLATTGNLSVDNSGGQDFVYVGSGRSALNGTMANINGWVNVYGAGSTSLYLGDSGDTTGRTVNLYNGYLTGLSPATIYWTPSPTSTGGVTFLDVWGSSGNNIYNVNNTSAMYAVTYLNTGAGGDTANIQATTGGLYLFTTASPGGSGNDQVNIGHAGSAQDVSGTVYISNDVSSDHVTIDDSADTANRSVIIAAGSVTGLAPAAVDFYSTASTLTILGGSGTDSYTVTGTPAGSVTLTAGSGTNTLIGPNVNSTWNITSSNAGTLQGSGLAPVNFTNMANLTGGSANDAFVFANGIGVTANVNGGSGNNLLDYLAYTTSVTVDLTAGTAAGVVGTVANINQVRGGQSDDTLNGNGPGGAPTTFFASPGTDTITGNGTGNTLVGTNANSTWTISAQNAGDLTWVTGDITNDTTFSGIQYLVGGSGNDMFALPVGLGVTGSIDGGGGTNTLDDSGYTTAVTVNLGTSKATGVGLAIYNLQTFLGGTSANTFVGPNAVTTWNITDQNIGNLTGGFSFNGFQNLTGGSGNDSFVVADAKGVDGQIDGGGGTNTLNDAAYTTSATVDLNAHTATGVGTTWANLQSFVGAGAGGNTLNGPNAATTWNITAQNACTLSGGFSFSAFQNLTGGAANNTFIFANGKGIDGNLDGGAGSNTLDESAYTTALSVNLAANTATGVGGNIARLQSFVGGSGSSTLSGPDSSTTWNLSGSNAGTLTGGLSFSAFGNLTGGAGDNTFAFAAGATLSGTLTAGRGINTLDYSAYTTSVIVDLQTSIATGAGSLSGTFANVKGGNSSGSGLYNLLIGNGGNTLTGGSSRRNILVAGSTASTLNGGGQDDLLIGGTTSYDTESGLTSWKQIAAYWAGSDSYSTRVSNLTSGSGVPRLDATVVTGNGGGNTMTGTGELALLYTDGADTVSSFNAGSQTVTISP